MKLTDQIRNALCKAREGLTAAQILDILDCEAYPKSSIGSLRVMLANLCHINQVKCEVIRCNCCMYNSTYYFITEQGRMVNGNNVVSENYSDIDLQQELLDLSADKE